MIFELGLPRRTFTSKTDAMRFINVANGIKTLYQSVYNFKEMDGKKPKYDTAIINCLFFDFDMNDDCWNQCNKLHQYLLKEDIKHILIWSGRGFHLLVQTIPIEPVNPKSTILNAQTFLVNQLDLICDTSVLGDYSRLRRVVNSYHLKAKRFCIYLNKEDFDKGYEHCKEIAMKQNLNKEYHGSKLLDLTPYDYETKQTYDTNIDYKFESSSNADYFKSCPDTIKELLVKKDLGWKERFVIIMYFKENGYTIKEVMNILKDCLSEQKFIHCIREERQLQYLFERDDLVLPEKYAKLYK